jgi:cell division protein FtsB
VFKSSLFLFVVLAMVFVLYLPSYIQMQGLRDRNEAFEKRIGELEKDTASLVEERDRLKNDPEYFERVARERMGLIKEGEVIYKVVPPGTKKTTPAEVAKTQASDSAKKSTAKNLATTKKTSKSKTSDAENKSEKQIKIND